METRLTELPIIMRREGSRLVALDAWSAEMLERLPEGVPLNVARPTVATLGVGDEHDALLRFYMAGINLLHKNTPDPRRRFPTPRHLRQRILKGLGFFEEVDWGNGITRRIPNSMAKEAMPLDELKICFELSRAIVLAWRGYDPWDVWKAEQDAKKKLNQDRQP